MLLIVLLYSSLLGVTATHYRSVEKPDERLVNLGVETFTNDNLPGPTFTVNPKAMRQEFIGWGSSFTEASAYNWASLKPQQQTEILDLLFSKDKNKGLGYTICRCHIGSADFALIEYGYADENDETLASFDLGEDRKYILPFIQAAQRIVGNDLKLFGSSWSPPAWMKDNKKLTGGGTLLPEHYDVYARYLTKYYDSYRKEGINFWGTTIQNEPEAGQSWESCGWSGQAEGIFAVQHLRPTLDAAGLEHIKIMIWDHNRDDTAKRADQSYAVEGARQAVWGMANHWYCGNCDFSSYDYVHEKYPEQHQHVTEFCKEGAPLATWWDGFDYTHEIINDLNHWIESITDWNMILDENGGPFHDRGGGVKAVIAVNRAEQTYQTTTLYYAMAHFAKFIRAGAHIVESTSPNGVEITAAVNADGSAVVVLMNRTDGTVTGSLKFGDVSVAVDLPSHSIHTYDIAF